MTTQRMFDGWADAYGSPHGWVYVALPKPVLVSSQFPPCVKIGMTTRSSRARASEWWKAGFESVCRWPMEGPNDEIEIHEGLRLYRVRERSGQDLDAVPHREVYLAKRQVVDFVAIQMEEKERQGTLRFTKSWTFEHVIDALDDLHEQWRWYDGQEYV